MITHILFDLDGTLTNPEEGITKCVAHALEHFGVHPSNKRELRKFIGPPLKDSFMEFYGFSESDALLAIEKYRERFSTVGIFENKLYSGTVKMLQNLKALGITLAVASSKPEVYTKKIIEHFDLSEFFDAVCGSELDGKRTAKSEVIKYALSFLGNPPLDDTIMVGDRKHDIIGAKKVGIRSIGVLYGFGSLDELVAAKADYIAEKTAEVYDIVTQISEYEGLI